MPKRRFFMRGVRRALAALLALQLTAPPIALALPHGAQVVGGAATITQDGAALQITQGTSKAIINWNGFSIGANELVRFVQPGASSAVLNRVVGGEASHILGQLLANGRIFLINPNGIIFGAGARVNVGSLLATTLNISDSDFMAGNYVFQREPGNLSTVVNQGTLTAADGGFIALSAPGVVNQGTITAKLGTVHLSSGDRLALDFSGDGLVRFAVSGAIPGVPTDASGVPLPARVSNEGKISATGGDVTLTARAVGDVLTRVVNNSGVIEAGSLVDRGGVVRLSASDPVANTGRLGADVHHGEVRNAAGAVIQSGTIDVSAVEAGAAPGEVTLSGQMVGLSGSILARGLDGRGGNVLLTSSERTVATTTGLIDVSGTGAASAGNVVLWSDDLTLFRGDILARGGALGGHGGQVEVSGKELLEFSGFVDTRAPLGTLGSLLLDPKNITVANAGGAAVGAVDEFSDTPAANVSISPATLNSAATNVMLQANNDITITNAINMTTAGADLTMLAGRSVIVNQNVTTNNGDIFIGANWQTDGVDLANRDAGAGNITIGSNRTLNAGTGAVTLEVQSGTDAGAISTGAMNAGAFTLTTPNTITLAGNVRARGGPIDLNANVVLAASLTLDTTANGAVATGGNITVDGTLNSNATARALTVNAGSTGDVVFNGAVGGTSALSSLTISNGRDVSLAAGSGTVNGLGSFGNTGVLTLGSASGTLVFGGGITATAPSSTTLAGIVQTTNDVLRLGAITLAADSLLRTAATNGTGDLFIGAVTGNSHNLTLSTGAANGADVNGTSVSGVDTLTLLTIGGRATFTGGVSVTTLAVPNSVANVSLIGTSGTITDAVTFANTGNLTLGAAGGTLTFTGGLTATAPASRTLAGTIETANAPLTLGAVTLGAATTLTTNATTGAGDLTVGAVTGAGNALTLSTGAVAGADVSGTSVSGVSTLTLQDIGALAAFTGAVSATTLNVGNTVNDVTLSGTSGTVTNAVTFGNTGALTLGAPGGTLTFTGGLTATTPSSTTVAGIIQTTNSPLTLGAATLAGTTTLRTNATSGAGDLTLGAITGGGNALTLSTGSAAGADLVGTSIAGVSTLTLQTIGGTAAFTDAVDVSTLTVASTVNGVSLTGATGTVANAATFSNTGALTLGSAGGTLTFSGGLTATAPASRTLAGTIETANAPLVLGSLTLADDVTLRTNATTGAGNLTIGAVTGAGHNLTLATGAVAGADVGGAGVAGVDTLTLQNVGGTATFTGALSVDTLATDATVNNLSLTGATGSVTNATAFANAGTLTLGTAGSTWTFSGGLTATAPAALVTGGTIQTQGTPMTLGALSLGANTTLTTNATDASGDLTIGAVTGNTRTLTLATGAVAGADVTGTSIAGVSTLALQNIGGVAAFSDAVTATTLTVAGTVNDVSLTGTSGTVTNAVTFGNAGTLTLGSPGGVLRFAGGVTATAPTTSVLAGTIETTSDLMTFGPIALGADTILTTNTGSSTGDIVLGAVTGNSHALTLATGAGVSGADVTGTSVAGVSTLTLQNIGGRATFTGDVSPSTLAVASTVANVSLLGATGTIADPVTFANTGNLTLGSSGGTLTFTGGLTATAPSSRTLAGTIQTGGSPMAFGAVTLAGPTTLTTNATSAAGDLTLGAVTGGGNPLTLSTGVASGADVTGTSVSGVSTLSLQDIGGTAAFTGAVSATALDVTATVNNVTLAGTSGTITNATTFHNTGALALGSAGGTLTFSGGLTATAPASRVLAGTIQTTNTPLTLGPSSLGASTTLRTNATSAAGDLTLDTITGNGFALTLSTGTGVAGADLSATGVSGVTTLTLQNIGGAASFTDAVNVTSLTVGGTVSGLSLTGTSGTVTNAVTLGNVGPLTLGSAGGTLTFAGGLSATAPGGRTLAGTIETNNAALVFGAVTLGDDTTLRTNATTTAGDLTVGAVTGGGHDLTLATGAGVAGANVSATTVSAVETLRLQNIGGTASFTGAVNAGTVIADSTVNAVSLTGSSGTIADTATFQNTGTLALGTTAGTLTFAGGLTATAPSITTTAGTIQTQSTPLTLGAVSLGAATTLTTHATDAAGDIVLGAITGNGRALTLSTGAGIAGADVTGTTVSGVSTLTLQDIGGTVTFTGPVSATTLVTANSVNNASLTGASGTITNAVTFGNTGTLTLGTAGGSLTFAGGLTATAPTVSVLAGTIQTTNDPLTLGAISLGADTVLRTNASSGAGDLTLGAVTGNGHALTVSTGAAAGADLTGTAVSGVGTLTLQNIGGTATFADAVNATTLGVAGTVNNVALAGASGTITNAVAFDNTGTLTLGSPGGTLGFTGGLSASGASAITVHGDVVTGGNIELSASGPIALGALQAAGDVTLATSGGSILGVAGVTHVTAGGALSATALGGTIGVPGAPVSVAIAGPASMNATGLAGGAAIVADGTVGSVVPAFPPTLVGAVFWNGVDLNAAIVPPVTLPVTPPVVGPDTTTASVDATAGTGAPASLGGAASAAANGVADFSLPVDPVTILTLISDLVGANTLPDTGGPGALSSDTSDSNADPRRRGTGMRLPGDGTTLPAGPLRPWNTDREP